METDKEAEKGCAIVVSEVKPVRIKKLETDKEAKKGRAIVVSGVKPESQIIPTPVKRGT